MEIIKAGENIDIQLTASNYCSSDDCRDTKIACAGDGICPDLTP